jgi:hypothetical protein
MTLLSVRLYGKAGCHLCEAAEADLRRLERRYPHALERVDIGADRDLLTRYGESIPVVAIGGQEFAAPLGPARLERILADARRGLA